VPRPDLYREDRAEVTGHRWLAGAAWALFYLYVVALVVLGVWGVFVARLDFPLLMNQPYRSLDPEGATDVLSQYRFLRAIEAGFGVFALQFRREIFSQLPYNRLFLSVMTFGIAARIVGIVFEGVPSVPHLLALAIELVGAVVIFVATREAVRERSP
jgi:hypothetical protein